jgi:hypothetical protein
LFEGCGEDMHLDWWAISGVKKPYVVEKGIPRAYQIAMTFFLVILKVSSSRSFLNSIIHPKLFCVSTSIVF